MKQIVAISLFLVVLASGCTQTDNTQATGGTESSGGSQSSGGTSGTAIVDCGSDRECFEDNMKTCTKSKVSITFGIEEELLFLMEAENEIKGLEGNDCVVYGKITKFELSEEIQDLAEQFPDVVGKDMTCRIPLSVLSGHQQPIATMGPEYNYCEGTYLDAIEATADI
jgi:hypothetical protein